MILETSRLELRPLQTGDAEAIWPYVSDPEISHYMSWDPHRSIEDTRLFIADVIKRMELGTTISWLVVERETRLACGLVSLLAIVRTHRSLRYDRAELAYWIGPPFQGRGYATEACVAVLKYSFDELNLNKIVVAHDSENDASRALICRLGFRHVGTEHHHFSKGDRWVDHVIYELLRNDN